MDAAGLKAEFVQGMRVTDEAAVKVVDRVLSREINPDVVSTINSLSGRARGFAGTEIFSCCKLWLADAGGGKLDPGFVGEVVGVKTRAVAGMSVAASRRLSARPRLARMERFTIATRTWPPRRRPSRLKGKTSRLHERRSGLDA